MRPAFFETTERVPVPPLTRRQRWWKGIEPPREVTPGLITFRGKDHRLKAELYHNVALEAGYASELTSTVNFCHVHVTERGR